ncbi:MAG: toprim domain-containing protein [Pseudohongiellaceae bacterium]
MNTRLQTDITQRLLNELEFREQGRYLRRGRCPECGKREMFVDSHAPWMLKCGRETNCGVTLHVKELFPDIFNSWSERFGKPDGNAKPGGTPVADAYLEHGRGFDLSRIRDWYTQEHYVDPESGAGTATVRFPLMNGFWERLIDKPERFGKKKARIKYGTDFKGWWWQPPGTHLVGQDEVWVVEGIFDAIALLHHGITAVAAISCNNYPTDAMKSLLEDCRDAGEDPPTIVWALDGDAAGRKYTTRQARKAAELGFTVRAAQIPQPKRKRDWNDLHQLDLLNSRDIEQYRYRGDLLLANSAYEKALLMYHHAERREYPFEFRNRMYWFKLDMERFDRAAQQIAGDAGALTDDERDQALRQSSTVVEIANCRPQALYFLANKITDESWYYFRVDFPHDGPSEKNTFSGGQLAASSEFKKRLLGIAPGAIWSGNSQQLDKLLREQLANIKTVETIDFIGYTKEHGAWIFGDVAVRGGKVHQLNAEDYFEMGRLSLKTLSQSPTLTINDDRREYRKDWAEMIWRAYGAQGVIAIAFWLGSLFAEQIRQHQKSYPFLEIIGEAGAGKSTLIEFLWKLCGRADYEGFDPSKASLPARARNFAQVANMPVVLIESDREQDGGAKQKQFDWDELKTLYNGRSVRARGQKNSGNDTYEPPFRGSVVISQNATVQAHEAVMQRIIHLHFTREGQSPDTRDLAEKLERMPVDHVSGFALTATTREKQIMEFFRERAPQHESRLASLPDLRVHRIAKNHGQMMALVECLGPNVMNLLPDTAVEQGCDALESMAVERQHAINQDHPVVQEFWDAYDYIQGLNGSVTLNHYRADASEIAINLKHFESLAAEHKLRVPPTQELKRYLKGSKSRRFVESNRAVRSIVFDNNRTVKCWIFEREK